jgi:hypothetical protein
MPNFGDGYGINWYKGKPAKDSGSNAKTQSVGDLAPDTVVTKGSQLFGRVKSFGDFPPYLTAHVVRKTLFRRSLHRARPNFKEKGPLLRVSKQGGFSRRTLDSMTVSAARELASVTGYRLYDPWRNKSPLVFAGNIGKVVVEQPTGGVSSVKAGGNVASGDIDVAIARSGKKVIKGEVNVGIDPTIELSVLTLANAERDILDYIYRAFKDAWNGPLEAGVANPPGPDELMEAFNVEYQDYLTPGSADGWEFVIEPDGIEEAEQNTREPFRITLHAPAEAKPTLFAVAMRDVNDPDGIYGTLHFDTSELVLVHPVDAEPALPEGF